MGFGRGRGFSPPAVKPFPEGYTGPYYVVIQDTHWTNWLRRLESGKTYLQTHGAPEASSINASHTRNVTQYKFGANYFLIDRKPLYFDTSVIPDTACVASAILSQLCSYVAGHNEAVHLFNAPLLNRPPVLADYGYIRTLTTDEIAILAKDDIYSDYANYWYLNKTGIDAINKTGWTKLAMRIKTDVIAQEPTTYEQIYLNVNPSYFHIAYYLPE